MTRFDDPNALLPQASDTHGYFPLSLAPLVLQDGMDIQAVEAAVNYGRTVEVNGHDRPAWVAEIVLRYS